jgi:predicted small metal-binding protein
MKSLSCKDVGVKDCDYTMTGRTDEEILQKAKEHGEKDHGMKEFPQELIDKVKSQIREVKAA